MSAEDPAGVHHQHGRAVDRRVRVHRVDEGHVIDAVRQVRKHVRDHLAALAVRPECPLRADDPPLVLLAAPAEGLHLDGLAVQPIKLRLVVERIDVARPAVHEQEDHALRLGRPRRLPRRHRIDERRDAIGRHRLTGQESITAQERERATEAKPPRPPTASPAASARRTGGRTCHSREQFVGDPSRSPLSPGTGTRWH